MARVDAVLPQAKDAVRVLGLEVARARRAKRWTQAELAERAGVSRETVRKVEHGGSAVAIGTAFGLAALVEVELFGASPGDLPQLVRRGEERLAVLPARVRARADLELDDDF
jgi:transcriptional regulator with XRE-family HTH domain